MGSAFHPSASCASPTVSLATSSRRLIQPSVGGCGRHSTSQSANRSCCTQDEFATYKGILDLLDAWKALDRHGARLVLVGEEALDAPLGELPLAPDVIVRGWSSRVLDYMRCCDVFVLPSRAEGMSNALLEAMACGAAPIATRVGAAPEMIEDGENGILINPGDVAGLGGAIEALIRDEASRHRMAANAARTTAERYGIGRVVDRIEAAYDQILAGVDA